MYNAIDYDYLFTKTRIFRLTRDVAWRASRNVKSSRSLFNFYFFHQLKTLVKELIWFLVGWWCLSHNFIYRQCYEYTCDIFLFCWKLFVKCNYFQWSSCKVRNYCLSTGTLNVRTELCLTILSHLLVLVEVKVSLLQFFCVSLFHTVGILKGADIELGGNFGYWWAFVPFNCCYYRLIICRSCDPGISIFDPVAFVVDRSIIIRSLFFILYWTTIKHRVSV